MSESTYEMASAPSDDNFKRSGDYAVYDSPEDPAGNRAVKGFAFLAGAAEQAGQFVSVTIDGDGDDLVLEKTTSATGRYATEGSGVRHIYIDHGELDQFGGEQADDGYDAPDTLGISVSPSDEESFEEARETADDAEEEAESLLSDAGSDDAVDAEEDEDDTSEAEELLEEAADAS